MTERRSYREVLAWMLAVLREHWRIILPAGLVIFIPLALLETIDTSLQEALGDADDLATVLELIAVAVLDVACALLGQIVFAGLISGLALHGGPPRGGVRALLGELPVMRLILADFAFVLVVVLGFVLLIVPGLVFIVWFSLIGPAIEVERIGIRAAFSRSRELVRNRFRFVAAFVLPVTIAESTLEEWIGEASVWSFGHTFVADWVAGSIAMLVTSTIVAVAVSVIYLELSGARSSPGTPAPGSPLPRHESPA